MSTVTTAIPGVWVSADHRCIVWCKQLVLTLNRDLFDIVDDKTKQISGAKKVRDSAFRYHLQERNAGKRWDEKLPVFNWK